MNNETIEQLTDLMLGDSLSKIVSIMNENKKIKKENELLKEELQNLKNDIIRVYNTMISLEEINKHELSNEDVEEL